MTKLAVVKAKRSQPGGVATGLSPAAHAWFTRLASDYGIVDSGGLAVLTEAARSFDRAEAARALVDAEGMTMTDRWGQSKVHPAVLVERDARAAMLSALRQLHLDVEPLQPRAGRPSGSKE